jgi:phosphoribosylcarboxyaminoimidazole (NCAIR) mutase
MSLQTRRPPGHAKRKALTYAAEIVSLRVQGHTLSAIREALEDAGVLVSISTVRREVLKGMSTTAVPKPAVAAPAPQVGLTSRGKAASAVSAPHPAPGATLLPGKAIAEEFMRGRPTNTLYLKESSK